MEGAARITREGQKRRSEAFRSLRGSGYTIHGYRQNMRMTTLLLDIMLIIGVTQTSSVGPVPSGLNTLQGHRLPVVQVL